MKIKIEIRKPRNPVARAVNTGAGVHRKSNKQLRAKYNAAARKAIATGGQEVFQIVV